MGKRQRQHKNKVDPLLTLCYTSAKALLRLCYFSASVAEKWHFQNDSTTGKLKSQKELFYKQYQATITGET